MESWYIRIDHYFHRGYLCNMVGSKPMIDFIVKVLPLVSALLYFIVAIGYGVKKEWPWCLVWFSYGLANVAIVWAAWEKLPK